MRRRELLVKKGGGVGPDGRGMIGDYEFVDLQLTGDAANLLFATWNVGASSETEYGNYYKYGSGATQYSADTSTSNYYKGTESPLNLTADTAHVVMGGDWRMPTYKELQALTAQTDYKWETNFNSSGVNGGKFTSKTNTNAYVFFPAAGYYYSGSLYNEGSYGVVWSSTPDNSSNAYYLGFRSGGKYIYYYYYRYYGQSVRGVVASS